MITFSDQLPTVHQVAAQFWDRDPNQVAESLNAIEVIKHNPGKVIGFFPEFEGNPPVFFKVYFNNAFVYEMRGLETASTMPQVPGVRTPTIIQVMSEYKAILTAKREWEDTTTPIKRFFVGSLGIDWYTLGRWLRAFHDSQVGQTPNEKFLRRKFEKIEAHMKTLQLLFTPKQIDTMQEIIERAKEIFATASTEWVISHGDFGLANIKMSNGKLEIIDFEDCQMAPRAFDIFNCLVRLEYAEYFPNIPKTYRHICIDLSSGYGLPLKVPPLFDFFYLLIKLEMLETYFRRRKDQKYNFNNKFTYFFFENHGMRRLKKWLNTFGGKDYDEKHHYLYQIF